MARANQHPRKGSTPRARPSRPPRAPARASTPATKNESATTADGERLQKVLASAGIASRRECEQLILDGRVEVDRKVVTELGTRVDPQRQEIRVDAEALPQTKHVYFAVNKPDGVVSTSRDPAGRQRVIDLLPPNSPRVFSVGRLDIASEGLIILTNDGELANGLTHPRHGVEKVYHVQVAGHVEHEVLSKLKRGIHLAEGFAHVKHVRIKSAGKKSTILEMILDEGRNREVRRLLARVGHKVQRLKRVAVGPVRLGEMPTGAVRPLTRREVESLERAVASGSAVKKSPTAKPTQPSKVQSPKRNSHKELKEHKAGRTVIG